MTSKLVIRQIALDLLRLSLREAKHSSIGLGDIEKAILKAGKLIDLNEKKYDKFEKYMINSDSQPEIIRKQTNQVLNYEQEIAVRYLRPPTPPPPGEIIIKQERNRVLPPAPPLILRQQPPRPITPLPLVIREAPPKPPVSVGEKVIKIAGKKLPPPPRKVVVERLPALPSKPQPVIVERWLPYKQVKRRVILKRPPQPDLILTKPKNVIIQWNAPKVVINKKFQDLGVVRADPNEYVHKYGSSLTATQDLPTFAKKIRPPDGVRLAADEQPNQLTQLEGDIHALELIDLDKHDLGEYKDYLKKLKTTLTEQTDSLSSAKLRVQPENLIDINEYNKQLHKLL